MRPISDSPGEMGNERKESSTDAIGVGRCASCETLCTVMRTTDGRVLAAGTDGRCTGCGGADFTVITD